MRWYVFNISIIRILKLIEVQPHLTRVERLMARLALDSEKGHHSIHACNEIFGVHSLDFNLILVLISNFCRYWKYAPYDMS
jgi:hypothetical protein